MYTIGQIAEILGISKDKLRYYEEKEIIKPVQNGCNHYRQYDSDDIDNALAIEYYRSLDLDFKTIRKLHMDSDTASIKNILNEKYEAVVTEIARMSHIAKRIAEAKQHLLDIEKNLNCYSLRSMAPVEILGQLSDFRAYEEFKTIHNNREILEDEPIFKSLKRLITFDEEGIQSGSMLVTKAVEDGRAAGARKLVQYDRCVYTILEDKSQDDHLLEHHFLKSQSWMKDNHYKPQGTAIIGMLSVGHSEGRLRTYLEVYIPVE
ncbi:hypothetical protein R70723_23125 [Paenibacillus sp. FSL R7-0273]|uniref:MerR family transcriptional regulator n=1 Tax=Paenibacillus sp. FSL R7-0273 TaxID=1536772 RepID=UPI0004F59785|nr:MerR family transcriptional regulator [Paenibacillus sp. FSL R7-0273]AIQ48484.1 hypothetical protein R70723_23125 [Paenibacillus sp. FSL R7-0273]OMF86303.1 hypothetical protein BK144_26270 [Paenibacillus sp. FSL R7-0273]